MTRFPKCTPLALKNVNRVAIAKSPDRLIRQNRYLAVAGLLTQSQDRPEARKHPCLGFPPDTARGGGGGGGSRPTRPGDKDTQTTKHLSDRRPRRSSGIAVMRNRSARAPVPQRKRGKTPGARPGATFSRENAALSSLVSQRFCVMFHGRVGSPRSSVACTVFGSLSARTSSRAALCPRTGASCGSACTPNSARRALNASK